MVTLTGYEVYIGKMEFHANHSHLGDRANWNMLLSLDGELKLGIGGCRLNIDPGTLFMIAPGQPRRFSVPEYWHTYFLHFNMDAHIQIPAKWPSVGPGVYAVVPNRDDFAQLRQVFDEIMHVCTIRRHGWYLLAYCLIQELILRGNMAGNAALGEHIEFTAKMLENLNNPRSIDDIAGKCAMSRSGFFTKFRATFGISPAKYREQQVMNKVQELLENSGMSIKEISREVGIGNPCSLSTRFKKAFGISPREFRSKHRADDTATHK